jgi:hypothetical protein
LNAPQEYECDGRNFFHDRRSGIESPRTLTTLAAGLASKNINSYGIEESSQLAARLFNSETVKEQDYILKHNKGWAIVKIKEGKFTIKKEKPFCLILKDLPKQKNL